MHVTWLGWTYIAIALILTRVFAGRLWRDEIEARKTRSPFFDDVPGFGCFVMGMVGAAAWPLVLAIWGLAAAYDRWPDVVLRVFFHEPSTVRRERRLERRREQVARLEQELGIDA